MPDSSQAFLREPDKKLWTAADRLRSNTLSPGRRCGQRGRRATFLIFSTNGAPHDSPRQRPGFASRKNRALKGRHNLTTKSIVSLIVVMIEPYQDRVYDPAMGSRGFFVGNTRPCGMRFADQCRASARGVVQSERFIENRAERHRLSRRPARRARAGAQLNRKHVLNKTHTHLQIDPANLPRLIDLIATLPFQQADRNLPRQSAAATGAKDILGPDPASSRSNASSAPLGDLYAFAVQNSSMAICGIDFDFGKEPADTSTRDQHPDLRALIAWLASP